MVKLIFNEKKNVKKTNSRSKYIIKNNKIIIKPMAPRLLNLPRKGTLKQRSTNIGMYPIPTGKILERYAYKHNLSNVLPVAKKLLSKGPTKLIGLDEDIDRSIPKKEVSYHEAMRRYKNMCQCKDSDGDGVVNMADCKPFDKNKQDTEDEIYDKHGHIKIPKERIMKDASGYIPLSKPLTTVEVETKKKKIITFESKKFKDK